MKGGGRVCIGVLLWTLVESAYGTHVLGIAINVLILRILAMARGKNFLLGHLARALGYAPRTSEPRIPFRPDTYLKGTPAAPSWKQLANTYAHICDLAAVRLP